MGTEASSDTGMNIQRTLFSINDVTRKIRKELQMIEELVKETGHLHTVVDNANETLSKQVQEMGMNVAEIISKSKDGARLESNLLDLTSEMVTKQLENIHN